MIVEQIKRVFKFKEIELSDPNTNMSPEAVLRFYSAQYPSLNNATIIEKGLEEGKQVFEMKETVGTKG